MAISDVCLTVLVLSSIAKVGYSQGLCENVDASVNCGSANSISNELISNVPNITEAKLISIRATCPLDIIPGAFQSAVKVQSIHLSYNTIDEIRSGTFKNLSIKVLEITDNFIGSIQLGAFSNIRRLESIELSGNQLKVTNNCTSGMKDSKKFTIERTVLKDLPNLKALKLNRDGLESIALHQLLTYPQRLELLYLGNNNLTNVTNDMLFQLSNLEVLNLDYNSISYIEPGCFGQTPKLKILNLYRNKLKEIDESVFPPTGMDQLEDLRLSFNKLMYLSSEFFERTKNLKQISIFGNPWWCPCLTKVETLLADKKIHLILSDFSLYYGVENKPICVNENIEDKECKKSYNSNLSEQYENAVEIRVK